MKFTNYPLVTLFFLYFLAYGLMLINEGVWWDDWCLYNMNTEGITEQFIGNGGFYVAPIHIFLQGISSSPPLVYHFLTFVMYFFISIFLYYSLPYLKIVGDTQMIITAFFTVLPINISRIYMICFPYTIGIFFCFAGLYFFTIAFYKKQLIFRLFALACFFLSFIFLPSTYVFIPMYVALLIWLSSINREYAFIENVRSFKKSYNMNDVRFDGSFDYYMIINEGDVKLRRTAPFVKLIFFEHFSKERFVREINNVLTITCLPYK